MKTTLIHGPEQAQYLHQHSQGEYNLVMSGSGSYWCGDKLYPLRRRTLIYFPSHVPHCLNQVHDNLSVWVFMAAVAKGSTGQSPVQSHQLNRTQSQGLHHLMQDVSLAADELKDVGFVYLQARCNKLLELSDTIKNDQPQTLHPVIGHLQYHLQQPGGLDKNQAELARACDVAPCTLTRLVRKELGHSLPYLRNRIRLGRLQELRLQYPDHTIASLCQLAGFGSVTQYRRFFTGELGAG